MFRFKLDGGTLARLKQNVETISSVLNLFKKKKKTPDRMYFSKDYLIYCAYNNTVVCRDIEGLTGLSLFTDKEDVLKVMRVKLRQAASGESELGNDSAAVNLQLISENLTLEEKPPMEEESEL
jgi:hypothetical protein